MFGPSRTKSIFTLDTMLDMGEEEAKGYSRTSGQLLLLTLLLLFVCGASRRFLHAHIGIAILKKLG